jgi:4-hydroxy-tetrahydrodipicolinate synthase
MAPLPIAGIIPNLVTPFDIDGKANLDLLRQQVEFLDRTGAAALCVGGGVGETAGSSAEELADLCQTVVRATRLPVLTGIYADSTREAVSLARAATEAGAAMLLVAPPHYLFQPEVKGLLDLFRTLRKNTPLPLLLSNTIATAQVAGPHILQLAEAGVVDGVCQGGRNAHLLADLLAVRPRVPVLVADEDLLYVAFLLGAEGAVTALGTLFPEDCVALYQAAMGAEHARAREIHERLLRLWRVLDYPTELLGRVKSALQLLGRAAGVPRSPYQAVAARGYLPVREALLKAGKI